MPFERRPRQRGFSLTELMVGVAVFSVILVVSIAIFQRFSKTASKLRKEVFTDRTFSGFSQRFVADVMNADVGLHFLNLPVRFACNDSEMACVRKLELDGRLSPVPAPAGISSIQFYRDEAGALENFAAYMEDQDIRIMRNRPLALNPGLLSSNLFVTWPLSDNKANAFLMMTRKVDSSIYFSFPAAFSQSNPSPSLGNWTVVEASTKNFDLNAVRGSLFVVFNSAEPLHYYVQMVDQIQSCKDKQGSESVCKKIADAFGQSAQSLDLLGGDYYKIRFVPVPSLAGFAPSSPKGAVPTGQWWSQPASEYLFPMRVVSIRESSSGLPAPDSRKLLHFYDMAREQARKPRLVALPVQLQAFTLEKGVNNTKVVVRRDFYPANRSIILRDLSDKTAVIIGRKLGTRDITVFKSK